MEYRKKLREEIDRYYRDILPVYQNTTAEAIKDAKKLGLFRKRDFSGHIGRFRKHMVDAQSLCVDIAVPPEDARSRRLAEIFKKSVASFILLCDENIRFYTITEKKQYRDSGVTVKEYAESCNLMQNILARAVKDLDELDQAYQQYGAGDLSD